MQPAAFGQEELPVHVKARRLVLPSVPLARPAPVAASFQCQLTCYGAGEPSQWCAELPIEGVVQGAFTWAWVKAMLYSTSVTQMRSHIDTHLLELRKQYRWLERRFGTSFGVTCRAFRRTRSLWCRCPSWWSNRNRTPRGPSSLSHMDMARTYGKSTEMYHSQRPTVAFRVL